MLLRAQLGLPVSLPTANRTLELPHWQKDDQRVPISRLDGNGEPYSYVWESTIWTARNATGNASGVFSLTLDGFRGWLFTDKRVYSYELNTSGTYDVLELRRGDGAGAIGEGDDEGDGSTERDTGTEGDTGLEVKGVQNGCDAEIDPTAHLSFFLYVDSGYVSQYDSQPGGWEGQVGLIQGIVNDCFRDVSLRWFWGGASEVVNVLDPDIKKTLDNIATKGTQGADFASYWVWYNFDGCTVGGARGLYSVVQHKPDPCHFNWIPDNDAERAYIVAHEWAHYLGLPGDHSTAWSVWVPGHRHRSIGYGSAWFHYHFCWSEATMDVMVAGLKAMGEVAAPEGVPCTV